MHFTSAATLEVLPRIEARLPSGAIAVAGDLLYPDFRARAFRSLLDVLFAVLVWTAGDLSLKDAAALTSAAGITVSKSSLEERFARAADWLQLLLSMTLCGNAIYPKGGELRVLLTDSTSLSAPGAKGTSYRVHALFDSCTGALVGARVTDASVGENTSHHLLGRESLLQADRGYCNGKNFHAIAARGAHFQIRCNPHSIRICDATNEVLRPTQLERLVHENAPLDIPVLIPARASFSKGPNWHRHPKIRFITARLIGLRTPKGVIWLLTNMPAETLPAKAAGELYRHRWQIELIFKALKTLGGLDRLKSTGPTATAWICGKLMLAALAQRILPSFEPQPCERKNTTTAARKPYRTSAWSRFRLALEVVKHLVLGIVLAAAVSDERILDKLKNPPRKRQQQAPLIPIKLNKNQLLYA